MDNKTNEKGMSLLVKLSGISTFFLLLAIVIFSVISVRSVQTSSMETAVFIGTDKLAGDMAFFEYMILHQHGQLSLHDNKLIGRDSVSLENKTEIVDKISSRIGIVATIFIREDQDFKRISTSLLNDKGERMVDTFLGTNSAAYSSAISGKDYSGNAVIFGKDYLTLYRPVIESTTNEVIGLLFIGIEMTKIADIISGNVVKKIIQTIIIAITILLALFVTNMLSINLILVKPIRSLTAIIRRLSMGDINLQIDKSKNHDEVGTMKNELIHLFDSLKRTAHFAQNIGNGNLDAEYHPLSSEDVLGNSLIEMRQSLQNTEKTQKMHAKNEKQRNWGTEGLAQFAEILRHDNDDMETLSYNIISNMVKYLNANQGGLFVLNESENEEDRCLEMKACYAFDRKKFLIKQIKPGEGLVGTCFLEGESIYITKVPDEYITITSGLGDGNPRAILLCPLKYNNEVYGVIELASFSEFEPYQLEFVQKVSESIASTISAVQVNLRTSRLLQQTRLQAEEMANQEEELRQNMEEMRATHEKIEEITKESVNNEFMARSLNQALLETFDAIEFTGNGTLVSMSMSVLNMIGGGLTEADFVGHSYAETYPGGLEDGRMIWERITTGERTTTYAKLGNTPGKIISIPVMDNQGVLQKVIVFALPADS